MPEKFLITPENVNDASFEELNSLGGVCLQRFGTQGRDIVDNCSIGGDLVAKRYMAIYPSAMGDMDISELPVKREELEQYRNKAMADVGKYLDEANAWMDKAAKSALMARVCNALLKRLDIAPLETTHNRWAYDQESFLNTERGVLSNAVYRFSYRHTEETGYSTRSNGQTAWYLTWSLCVRAANPEKVDVRIAGQERKRFTSKDEMIAYLAGRQKKFEKLFEEEFPPVPKQYEYMFSYAGTLLPGYTLEGGDSDQ